MRQYYQGTLDFSCGIYAVINSLALTHGLGLEEARSIHARALAGISSHPDLWQHFLCNNMDHYGVVRHMLHTFCGKGSFLCRVLEPFGSYFTQLGEGETTLPFPLFNTAQFVGDGKCFTAILQKQPDVWQAIYAWFTGVKSSKRTAILRFHRFMLGTNMPFVSHWTTVKAITNDTIILFDSSLEARALQCIAKTQMHRHGSTQPDVLISPDSLLFLEKAY